MALTCPCMPGRSRSHARQPAGCHSARELGVVRSRVGAGRLRRWGPQTPCTHASPPHWAAHGPWVRFARAGAPVVLTDGALRRLSAARAGWHAPVPFAGAFVLNLGCSEAAVGPTVRLSRLALEGILGAVGLGCPTQRVCAAWS